MRNALKDLSTITTIPYNSIVKLMDKLGWVISDCVEESTIKGEDYAQIDLGIGKLDIAVVDDEVHYRFVPSSRMEENIRQTIENKKNPLVCKTEEALVNKIVNAYKNLF